MFTSVIQWLPKVSKENSDIAAAVIFTGDTDEDAFPDAQPTASKH